MANSSARPANRASTQLAKRHGAIARPTTASIDVMPVTTTSGPAALASAWMTPASAVGSDAVRMTRSVAANGVCAAGSYMSSCTSETPRYRTSLTTPTTVRHAFVPAPRTKVDVRKRRPIGSCPGHNRAAVLSLTMATRGPVAESASANTRPRLSGMLMARK